MASGSVSVRLPEDILKKLEKQAQSNSKSMSEVVRELIERGLKTPSEQSELAGVHARIEKLEESIKALVGGGIDTVNADFWQANEVLLLFMKDALAQAAEARYFARLGVSYGMDIAQYVAQKTEVGVTPTAPDKVEKSKQLAIYDQSCKESSSLLLGKVTAKD